MLDSEKITWWEWPDGFKKSTGFPDTYKSVVNKTGDWNEILRQAGYEMRAHYGEDTDSLAVEIHDCKEGHLLVQTSNETGSLSLFLVAEVDQDIFFATWYQEFLKAAALVQQAEDLKRISNAAVAFVRHGQGEDTIDEWGDQTRDDYDRQRRIRAREALNKK